MDNKTTRRKRRPVSQALGVKNHSIFMFNCLYGFSDSIYYIEELETAVIFTFDSNNLNIYDIISTEEISVSDIAKSLPSSGTVRLHFTPNEAIGYAPCLNEDEDSTLFVRPADALGFGKFIFPETSHT